MVKVTELIEVTEMDKVLKWRCKNDKRCPNDKMPNEKEVKIPRMTKGCQNGKDVKVKNNEKQ